VIFCLVDVSNRCKEQVKLRYPISLCRSSLDALEEVLATSVHARHSDREVSQRNNARHNDIRRLLTHVYRVRITYEAIYKGHIQAEYGNYGHEAKHLQWPQEAVEDDMLVTPGRTGVKNFVAASEIISAQFLGQT